jgi:hypothetical protein
VGTVPGCRGKEKARIRSTAAVASGLIRWNTLKELHAKAPRSFRSHRSLVVVCRRLVRVEPTLQEGLSALNDTLGFRRWKKLFLGLETRLVVGG